jgi:hypothetical protein
MSSPTYTRLNAFYAGDTFFGAVVTVKDEADNPVDITNVTEIRCEFRLGVPTGQLQTTRRLTVGITITDAVNGVFTLEPFVYPGAPGETYFDFEMTWNDGRLTTVAPAVVTVWPSVTRNV